jgi:hypothetical protein
VQQGSIAYAFQSAASSGDDPLVDLIDAHKQAPNDIGIVSIWLCHNLYSMIKFFVLDGLLR